MEERGRVMAVDGLRAQIEVVPDEACKHCSARGICNWTGERKKVVLARNEVGAQVGETVVILRSGSSRTVSALLIFGLPALLLLSGVVAGTLLLRTKTGPGPSQDLWAAVLGGVGLAIGIGIVKLLDMRTSRTGRALPVVVRQTSEGQCPTHE